ncbi:hypothetical protein DRO02_04420 [archaeon]|nr:MAG: hypothetical protein DRO21_04805 [archaeon]RLG64426.1 MAG: hypothetical protein DRN89_02680 [archaeon]RLG64453.1 MAG: hypothetical protein DRO02_04420 [archaeon]
MSETDRRVALAIMCLLFRRHRKPGCSESELREIVGDDFKNILKIVDSNLSLLGLQVKSMKSPVTGRKYYYVTFRRELSPREFRLSGWRIDDVAMLVATIGYIVANGGKAHIDDVKKFLREKFSGVRVDMSIGRFIREGYIAEEENILTLDWRTYAEIDVDKLVKLLVETYSS